jgi:hypothetical protein
MTIKQNHRQKFEKCFFFPSEKLHPIWRPQANNNNIILHIVKEE